MSTVKERICLRRISALLIISAALFAFTSCGGKSGRDVVNFPYMKAVWVSQYDMSDIYMKGGSQRDRDGYTRLVRQAVANIVSSGFNTVILQIRPFGDSMYPSAIYPSSRFVTGVTGADMVYDPVDIFVTEAKAAGLSVQAWINPLRLMTPAEAERLPADYLIYKWYRQGALPCVDGRLYLDPARPCSRELIISGAVEALTRYGFDGLHIDDYFYPTKDLSFDEVSFAESGARDIGAFRRGNIDALVSGLYAAVKSVDERLIFGIAPAGNLETVTGKYYADVRKWCAESGFADYIMPQIYFGLEHGRCPFAQTVRDWNGIIKNGTTKLYVGMTVGKAIDGYRGTSDEYAVTAAGMNEWIDNRDVLKRCLSYLLSYGGDSGYCFFCYSYLFDPVSGEREKASAAEADAFLPLIAADDGTLR